MLLEPATKQLLDVANERLVSERAAYRCVLADQ
jgi:hypothetical protein